MTRQKARRPLAPPEGNNTIALPSWALHGLLSDLGRTISDDPTVTPLHGIALHTKVAEPTSGNLLYGTSTNRYLLAQGLEDCDGALPLCQIHRTALDMLLPLLLQGGDEPVYVHIDEDDLITFHVDHVGQVRVWSMGFGIPDVGRLVIGLAADDHFENRPMVDGGNLAPAELYQLSEIAERRKAPLGIKFGEHGKPAVVAIGDKYRAILSQVPTRTYTEPFTWSYPESRRG